MLDGAPIGIPEAIDGTQTGLAVYLLIQLSRLLSRVNDFLDATKEHQKKVRVHLRSLVQAVNKGAPDEIVTDPTPQPRAVESFRRKKG